MHRRLLRPSVKASGSVDVRFRYLAFRIVKSIVRFIYFYLSVLAYPRLGAIEYAHLAPVRKSNRGSHSQPPSDGALLKRLVPDSRPESPLAPGRGFLSVKQRVAQ